MPGPGFRPGAMDGTAITTVVGITAHAIAIGTTLGIITAITGDGRTTADAGQATPGMAIAEAEITGINQR